MNNSIFLQPGKDKPPLDIQIIFRWCHPHHPKKDRIDRFKSVAEYEYFKARVGDGIDRIGQYLISVSFRLCKARGSKDAMGWIRK